MQLYIQPVKKKIYLLGLIALLVLLGICISWLFDTKDMQLAFNGLFNYVVAGLGVLFALYRLTLFYLIAGREWLDPNASITITSDGMYNRLNYYSSGNISYDQIEETRLIEKDGKDYLIIVLKSPQLFIRQKPLFKKLLLQKVYKRTGSPLLLRSDDINYDLKSLQNIIDHQLKGFNPTS